MNWSSLNHNESIEASESDNSQPVYSVDEPKLQKHVQQSSALPIEYLIADAINQATLPMRPLDVNDDKNVTLKISSFICKNKTICYCFVTTQDGKWLWNSKTEHEPSSVLPVIFYAASKKNQSIDISLNDTLIASTRPDCIAWIGNICMFLVFRAIGQ